MTSKKHPSRDSRRHFLTPKFLRRLFISGLSGFLLVPSLGSAQALPVVTLSQSSATSYPGEIFSLTWNATDASSCAVYKTVGRETVTETVCTGRYTGTCVTSIPDYRTAYYYATCSGNGGSASSSQLTHTMIAPPQVPVAVLSQSSASTVTGNKFSLTWSSTNATSCRIMDTVNSTPAVELTTCNPGAAANGACEISPTTIGSHVLSNVCTGSGGTASSTPITHTVVAPPPVPVATLSQSLTTTTAGSKFSLSWNSTNATSCRITDAINSTPAIELTACGSATSGVCEIAPTTVGPHVFSNVCTGSGGTASSAPITHTVVAPPPVPVATLSQSSASTVTGNKFSLTWSSTNATSCRIMDTVNSTPAVELTTCNPGTAPSGSCEIAPSTIGSHVLSNVCTGAGGTASSPQLAHTVVAAPQLPVAALSQSLDTTNTGDSFILTWSSTNATYCRIMDTVNSNPAVELPSCNAVIATNGSCRTSLSSIGSHVLRNVCTGPDGTASSPQLTHTVVAPPQVPDASLTQSSTTTVTGGKFTLTWNSTNATSCRITDTVNGTPAVELNACNPGAAPSGSCEIAATIIGSHVFSNVCTGATGTSAPAVISHTVAGSKGIWQDQTSGNETTSWGTIAVGGPVDTSGLPRNSIGKVYVIDSSVGNEPQFGLNLIDRTDMNGNRDNWAPAGCYSHATAVAGIIGATRDNSATIGINPGTPIVSVGRSATLSTTQTGSPCLDTTSDGIASDPGNLLNALITVKGMIQSSHKVGIVNISTNYPNSERTSAIYRKMEELAKPVRQNEYPGAEEYPGAFIVQSAGNDYLDACDYAYQPETGKQRVAGIMVIGGIDDHGLQATPLAGKPGFPVDPSEVASLTPPDVPGQPLGSNYGKCVDAWAPGSSIYVPWRGSSGHFSGTSFAAPYVSGLASYLVQLQDKEQQALPETQRIAMTPAEIQEAIKSFLVPIEGAVDKAGEQIRIPRLNKQSVSSYSAGPKVELEIDKTGKIWYQALGVKNISDCTFVTHVKLPNSETDNTSTNRFNTENPYILEGEYLIPRDPVSERLTKGEYSSKVDCVSPTGIHSIKIREVLISQ